MTKHYYLTARRGERLAKRELKADSSVGPFQIELDPATSFQQIHGFGGCFNEAGWYLLTILDSAKREEILRSFFHPIEGANFTLARTPIGSSDFALQMYDLAPRKDDMQLESFTIEQDRRWLIPYIKAALAYQPVMRIFASPWSPPPWMKTNRSFVNGGQLRPDCYGAYAEYFVKYLQAYAAEGITIEQIVQQNEPMSAQPFESCLVTPSECIDFTVNHLAPALKRAGLETRIHIYEHNKDHPEWPIEVLNDPRAKALISGVNFHSYGGDSSGLAKLHAAHPEMDIWHGEYMELGGIRTDFADGQRYGRLIIDDLNNWCNGWIIWNLVLDQESGPTHSNLGGWRQDAVVIVNPQERSVTWSAKYFYLVHFGRFLLPGSIRIGCRSQGAGLSAVAARRPDGSLALVAMNECDEDRTVSVKTRKDSFSIDLPACSIASVVI